jgi:di/tricarboxylate transporter
LTAVLIIIALVVTGILEPETALSGFGSEPAIIVATVFVLSESLFRTGLSDRLGIWIGRLAGVGYHRIIATTMLSVAALSAFTHHVTMTAVMLPVMHKISREQNIAPSKLLIPLSFAASLGTTITIIGAPAFLIADNVLRQAGRSGLQIFAIAPIGIALSLAGTVFMLLFGRFLLPDRKGPNNDQGQFQMKDYYTELLVMPSSSLINMTIREVEENEHYQLRVAGWLRSGRPLNRPFDSQLIRAGDVLLVRTTSDDIAAIQEEPGLALHAVVKYGQEIGENGETFSEQMIQAVVAPGSELINRTIGRINFLQRYGVIVVGLWRHRGWLRAELSSIKLHAGDILVLVGNEQSIEQLSHDRSFLMFVPFRGEPLRRHKASLAAGLMITTIAIAAFNLLPVEISLLGGAAAVVLAGCITLRQAYVAIDTRIYIFIAGAIPLGLAMTSTGTADLLGGLLNGLVGSWPPFLVLFLLFMMTAVITQLMSDAATTALLAPVAIALAQALNQAPEPYVITVAMAAVASFFTPIGHHGNLLVYGPGQYRFSDFLRVGSPLTLLVSIIVVILSLLLWGNS